MDEAEQEFIELLKKLVECPLFDVVSVPLNSIKDIFNAIAERLVNWRTLAQESKSRAALNPGENQETDSLVVLC